MGKFSPLPPPPAEIPTAALLLATVSSFASSGSRDLAATRAAGSSDIRVVDDFNKAWIAADAAETAGDLHAAGPSRSAQALHALQVAALDVTRISEVNFSSFIQNTLVPSATTSPRDWCLVLQIPPNSRSLGSNLREKIQDSDIESPRSSQPDRLVKKLLHHH